MGRFNSLITLPYDMLRGLWRGLRKGLKKSWQQSISHGLVDKSRTVVPPAATPPPPAFYPADPARAPLTTAVLGAFDPSTLSCEKYDLTVDATIDYVDLSGNATRREITTEENYEYEDGVVVIRAFCHKRKDYRTFVSSRIKYWIETNSGKPVLIQNLAKYLLKASRLDLNNVALSVLSLAVADVQVFVQTAGKYTKNTYVSRNGLTYYRVSLQLVNSLVDYHLSLPRSRMLTESLNSSQIDEVKDILRGNLLAQKVTDTQVYLAKKILKDSELSRRKALVDFAEVALKGMPAKKSIIQVLSEELLFPSFRIATTKSLFNPCSNPEQKGELDEYLTRLGAEKQQAVADIKSDSEEAEREFEAFAKTELPKSKRRSKKHQQLAELNVIRNLARQECHIQLLKNLQEGKLTFEREPFEQEIRRRVCALLTNDEITKYGDMILPYLGNGIQFGYLVTGLKKKNRGWYPNENGTVVIDLNNMQKD